MTREVKPQQGGQEEYFKHREFEVLFGGAAGPGKSWALVIDALGLQFELTKLGKPAYLIPDYRAVLFRRKTTQLSKLIDEGKKYYCRNPFNGEYVSKRVGEPGPSFTFPCGSKIFMCHMEHEDDRENHQGAEYPFVGFDELTQFTLTQYLYLFSRCRSTIDNLDSRIRSTTNPTGPGLMWVKKRFIKNGSLLLEPKKTYYFIPDPENVVEDNPTGIMVDKDNEKAKSRTFIPGLLEENKILMQSDPTYALNIMQMGKKYEEALLKGNWDAFGGDFFDDFSTDLGVEPFEIPEHWTLIGSVDPGWSSPCSFGLTARDEEDNLYRLFTYYAREKSPQQHAEAVKTMIQHFQPTLGRMPEYIVSGRDAWAHKDRYGIVSHEQTWFDVWCDAGLYLNEAQTDRIQGWWAWKNLMRQKRWFYFKGYNDSLIEEIVSAQHDDKDPEDILGKGNDPSVSDHALDENRYAVLAIGRTKPLPKKDKFAGMPKFGIEPEKKKDIRVFW